MKNIRNKLPIICALIALVSCTCATPLVVSEIQKSDKKLTCKDIILEINESEHYKELAKKERGIGMGNALMPVCWATSYLDAQKAVDAAKARMAYLGKIYDVLDCGGKSDKGEMSAAPAGSMPPPFMQVPPAKQMRKQKAYAPVQPQQQPQDTVEEDDAPAIKGERDVDDQMVRKESHQHIDKFGKVYTHSHPYGGPHRHADDK